VIKYFTFRVTGKKNIVAKNTSCIIGNTAENSNLSIDDFSQKEFIISQLSMSHTVQSMHSGIPFT